MNLTHSSQQHTGAQLPSLREGRICQTCADIQDPGHWSVMPPSISLESGECVYTVSSAAGSYECSESSLRWSCSGPVILQYRISKEELFWAQLQMLGYRPAGPLMEIKLLSGELGEVYLPHSLCLGGSDPVLLGDAVRALHSDDSGVSLETCELSRFHGKLLAQHFSVWQLVVRLGIPVKDHCEVLICEHCPWPLVLHTYLLPLSSSAKQEVKSKGGRFIGKSSPVQSLWIDSTVQLHTSPDSLEITPSVLIFNYRNPSITFFEVYLENPLRNFKMEIKTAENQTVWEAVLRQGVDYLTEQNRADSQNTPESNTGPPQKPNEIPGQVDCQIVAEFLKKTRPKLIQRVTEVMPIADQLLSQEMIGQETYANIQAAATIRALHGDDNGVSLETCELSLFHGKLSAQQLSLWQLVASLGVPVKSHCKVLIYEHCPSPLVFDVYLLPSPSSAIQAVESKWSKNEPINKPSPDQSLWIDSTFQLHTSCPSDIKPTRVTLSYKPEPSFYQVGLMEPPEKFDMELQGVNGNQPVWEIVMWQGVDYNRRQDHTDSHRTPKSHTGPPQQPSRTPVDPLLAAASLEEKRPKLIQRVTEVMPIADQLLSQRIIGQETYANIQAAATSQDKMRLLFDGLRSAGAQGKLAFCTILQAQHPHLVEELWSAR
ncbi:NACHT, LRR and PYD domains-containing protein 1 homolog [Engraulis encrasicolus]|uniref:NACHT, LRR and PYD domains-containing protein 1 homolog n=1 Tax=Engraulis encrasicolus TaxID=184585 RepID=UPI002FD42E04